MASTKPIYVSPHEKGWQVKREKAAKALFVFETKKEAMEKAKEVAISTGCYIVEKNSEGKVVGTKTTFRIDITRIKPAKKKTAVAKKKTAPAKKKCAGKTKK